MPKPKPFSRESISIGSTVKRSWRWVTPENLKKGDTISGFGTINTVTEHTRTQTTNVLEVDGITSGAPLLDAVQVWNAHGEHKMLAATAAVYAFCTDPE